VRAALLSLVVACGSSDAPVVATHPPAPVAAVVVDAAAPVLEPAPAPASALPAHDTYDDLATALVKTIPDDARVIGFGELHARIDRAQVRSSLSRFTTDGLPAIAAKLSDLVVETWIIDGKCGSTAKETSAKVETTMRRPVETKSEITQLAEAARAAKIQPHAMKVSCDDFTRIAPKGKDIDPEALLALTTRELGRISTEAVMHRDREPDHRPWIAVYGGALHNDRFPDPGVEDFSYARKADDVTHGHFIEIDLIVPELAEPDTASQKQPWFPLVTAATSKVTVWKRGERSFVFVLPRSVKQ
jgi:hypothetical protein